MGKEKPQCAKCGRIIEGSNFLGYCSQICWKNSQKSQTKSFGNKHDQNKHKQNHTDDEEQIIIKDSDSAAAKSLVLQKLEELAVVGVTSITVIHPAFVKDEIRSPEFRKSIGELGLKFRMQAESKDTETRILNISF